MGLEQDNSASNYCVATDNNGQNDVKFFAPIGMSQNSPTTQLDKGQNSPLNVAIIQTATGKTTVNQEARDKNESDSAEPSVAIRELCKQAETVATKWKERMPPLTLVDNISSMLKNTDPYLVSLALNAAFEWESPSLNLHADVVNRAGMYNSLIISAENEENHKSNDVMSLLFQKAGDRWLLRWWTASYWSNRDWESDSDDPAIRTALIEYRYLTSQTVDLKEKIDEAIDQIQKSDQPEKIHERTLQLLELIPKTGWSKKAEMGLQKAEEFFESKLRTDNDSKTARQLMRALFTLALHSHWKEHNASAHKLFKRFKEIGERYQIAQDEFNRS